MICVIVSAAIVSSCGFIPIIALELDKRVFENDFVSDIISGFAVGSILVNMSTELISFYDSSENYKIFLLVALGFLIFYIIEIIISKITSVNHVQKMDDNMIETYKKEGAKKLEFMHPSNNNKAEFNIVSFAIINAIANIIDNFSHAIGLVSSFYISLNFGIMTTISLIFHEIPHEISNYYVLVKSGISLKIIICLQVLTSLSLFISAMFTLFICRNVTYLPYIIAMNTGGFIFISLLSLLNYMYLSIARKLNYFSGIFLGTVFVYTISSLFEH